MLERDRARRGRASSASSSRGTRRSSDSRSHRSDAYRARRAARTPATCPAGVRCAGAPTSDVRLVSCRLDHAQLRESMALEEHRLPVRGDGARARASNLVDSIAPAARMRSRSPRQPPDDLDAIEEIAYSAFTTGRFLLDWRLPPELSKRRYATWVRNSFEAPQQTVLKAEVDGELVGFFIVENRADRSVYWHLTADRAPMARQGHRHEPVANDADAAQGRRRDFRRNDHLRPQPTGHQSLRTAWVHVRVRPDDIPLAQDSAVIRASDGRAVKVCGACGSARCRRRLALRGLRQPARDRSTGSPHSLRTLRRQRGLPRGVLRRAGANWRPAASGSAPATP